MSPVVGVGHPRSRREERLELPSPHVPRRRLTHLSRLPGDTPTFDEVHDVVLTDAAHGEPHGEYVSDDPYTLSRGGFFQVLVAVPARLLCWVCDELEYSLGTRRHLAGHHDDARGLLLSGHSHIQPLMGHGPHAVSTKPRDGPLRRPRIQLPDALLGSLVLGAG